MKTGYVTDSFSTLGGLAAVAYGDPEYFREVQNQIYSRSPTRFLDSQRPSDVFESFFGTKELFTREVGVVLDEQYADNNEFTDLVDILYGPDWRSESLKIVEEAFLSSMDSTESYGMTLTKHLEEAVITAFGDSEVSVEVTNALVTHITGLPGIGTDAELMARAVSNNPQTKISVPPNNTRVDLENSVDLGLDYRGERIETGYLSPQEYWGNIAFRGLTNSVIPTGLKDSIDSGYTGYLSLAPLEGFFNPAGAVSISNVPPEALSASIYSQLPESGKLNNEMFSISLMGEMLNGYTTFDPATMSNGDLIDRSLAPTFEEDNKDPLGGLNPSARNFTPTF